MVDTRPHPLIELLSYYYKAYSNMRSQNADLSNLDFHQRYGLYFNGPIDWPYVEAVKFLMDLDVTGRTPLTVIYSSTDMYRKIYKGLGLDDDDTRVGYVSFADIYYAIHREQNLLSSIKNRISNSGLVVCAGALGAPDEVMTQIRAFTDGCLIVLG